MTKFFSLHLSLSILAVLLSGAFAQQETDQSQESDKASVSEQENAAPSGEQEKQRDAEQPQKKIRKVTRVKRPDFTGQGNDVWYKDVFKDGLVGDRPDAGSAKAVFAEKSNSNVAGDGSATQGGWASLIDGTTIEDEIKSLNQELAKTVTTPVKFKTAYDDVRQTMAQLSMAFAIIRDYDGEVRWKDHAANAQAALAQAAISARSNEDSSFNYCNARKFDLEDLVRGGSFDESEKPAEELDWSDVIGRSETMVRLEKSDQLLKEWTADEATFAKQKSKIISEAQWVAAIAEVIAKENMDDADVDEYVEYCVAMKDAAVQAVAATKINDYASASKFANLISQSCNNCHEDWR